MQGYRYTIKKHHVKTDRYTWRCATNHRNNMYADYDPVFTTSRFGKPAIQMGPYRFNRWSGSRGPRARWVCCKVHGGCKATIITLQEEIIKFVHQHNH
ncbi:FLYWCH zinc finger domain-containing protein [Phthorimaea operculella]|nr:FLYWCH zinc finger domain-containing protein [Phthorimaea operculella]